VVKLGDLKSSTQSDDSQPNVVLVRAAPRELRTILLQIQKVLGRIDDAGYAGNKIQVAGARVFARSPTVVRRRPGISHTYAMRPKAMDCGRVGLITLDQLFEPVLRIDYVVIRGNKRRIEPGFAIDVWIVLGVRAEVLVRWISNPLELSRWRLDGRFK
jgi:hypothetical protein